MSTQPELAPAKRSLAECDRILTGPGEMYELDEAVIKGHKTKIFKHAPPSLRALWLGALEQFGAKEYLVLGDERLTYRQTHEKAVRMASLLAKEYHCKKGEKVAILMRNRPDWVVTFWAIHLLGCVAVAVNAWLTPDGLLHCIKLSDSVLLVVDEERATVLASMSAEVKKLPKMRGILVSRQAKPPAGMRSLEDALKPYRKDLALPAVEIQPDDDATIFFTSGTTSFPKAVLSAQRGFITNLFTASMSGRRAILRKGEEVPVPQPSDPQKVLLLAVPLFHVTGCQSFLQLMTAVGGKVLMMHKWSAKEGLRLCKAEKVTYSGGVPFIAQELLEGAKGDELGTLDTLSYGGAPCNDGVPALAAKRPQVLIAQAYGLTETNSVVVGHAGEDYIRRPLSTGLISLVNEVKMVGPDGKTVPTGETGELYVRGPNVMKGYYNDAAASKAAFSDDGFFITGDLASIDSDGFVYIRDRAKDMIIRNGENISATAVENALCRDARIQDCAVLAVKDAKVGETPAAVVVLRADAPDTRESDIIEGVRKHLPRHAVPVMIIVRKAKAGGDSAFQIERNPNGKILKKDLKPQVEKEWQRRNKSKL